MLPIAMLPVAGLLLRFGQPDLLNIAAIADAGNAILLIFHCFLRLGLLLVLPKIIMVLLVLLVL